MTREEKLIEMGITLPAAPKPLGSYVACVRSGNLLLLSGMLPLKDGKLSRQGKVGEDVSLAEAREDARQAVINALSVVKSCCGSIEAIKQCVKINGYVASAPAFTDQPGVLNAASDLLFKILGEPGRHARVAVGVSVLPLNSPLEIDFIFEI